MHKVSEGDIDAIIQTTVLFYHTDEIVIPELADTKTDPPQNLQGNGTTPPVDTQPSSPHSPLEDTLVASDEPPPCTRVEAGDAALQVRAGDLPYV